MKPLAFFGGIHNSDFHGKAPAKMVPIIVRVIAFFYKSVLRYRNCI